MSRWKGLARSVFALLAIAVGALGVSAITPSNAAIAYRAGSPPARERTSMVYDAAHGEVVLFGGLRRGVVLGDTWTWDGVAWKQRHPVVSPPARNGEGLAYDAARQQVVLFGGSKLNDTWTWDGETWTEQHPPVSPPADNYDCCLVMADDEAHGDVVLYDGYRRTTWTWDGTTWTEQDPRNGPGFRWLMSMTYDAANQNVVLFGGVEGNGWLGDTWVWNGTEWHRHFPSRHPSDRYLSALTFDPTLNKVLLFGGGADRGIDDTWTWNGSNWARMTPRVHPSARCCSAISVDRLGRLLLFGGSPDDSEQIGDTWAWNGKNWRIPFTPHTFARPDAGPPGASVRVVATGYGARELVTLTFVDSAQGPIDLGTYLSTGHGILRADVIIPANATPGRQRITAVGATSGQKSAATFRVT
jgi:hypothetical protein